MRLYISYFIVGFIFTCSSKKWLIPPITEPYVHWWSSLLARRWVVGGAVGVGQGVLPQLERQTSLLPAVLSWANLMAHGAYTHNVLQRTAT